MIELYLCSTFSSPVFVFLCGLLGILARKYLITRTLTEVSSTCDT